MCRHDDPLDRPHRRVRARGRIRRWITAAIGRTPAEPCPWCHGTGWLLFVHPAFPCAACHGTGRKR